MPLAVLTAVGSPDNREWARVERKKRRMEYAAELGTDCFMVMNGPKPGGRPVTDDHLTTAAKSAEAWAEYAEQVG